MLISIANLAYIPSGLLFAGLPNPAIHASLASVNSPLHSTFSVSKGYGSVDRFSKAVVFAGAAALLAHASGNDIVHSFSRATVPPSYSATKTYPIAHTFASEGHQPRRTPNIRNNGRSSVRGRSSDSLRSRNYNLRSRTRANQGSGTPPSEDPEGDPLLSAASGGRGRPTRPSSRTAPHAPVEGSGPPPPPPPASSVGSVADDNEPLSAVLSLLEPILVIYILALLCSMLMKEEAPRKAPPQPTPIVPRLPTSPLQSLSTTHLPPISSFQQGSFVCLTSALEAISACAPQYSLATSFAKSVLTVLVASCHDYVRKLLPLIAFCLLPVGCYLLGLFDEVENAATPFEQIVVQGAHEILHETYLPSWSADPSLEIGRVEVDEILVPMHADINASLFAHWGDVEGGMRDGAEYLLDKAFFEESVLTDWDDLLDGGSLFKEMDQISFDLSISCNKTPTSPLSPCRTGQEASLKWVFTGSTPRPSKFNSNISGGTRSRSPSISETDSFSADMSIPLFETPTRPSTSVGVLPASGPRAPCASVQAPQMDENDSIASLAEDGETLEELTPSSTGPSMLAQAFEPRSGYRRRRKHRRRSKNNANQVDDSNAAAAADKIISA